MNPEKRNRFGNVIQPDSPKVPAGENAHPEEYFDKVGKQTPGRNTILTDGTPIYGQDGCTQEWTTQQRRKLEGRE